MPSYHPDLTKVKRNARRHGIDPCCVKRSTRKHKKIMVCNPRTGRYVHFGDTRYPDFLTHKDPARRAKYLKRSRGIPRKRMSPNDLARKLLW